MNELRQDRITGDWVAIATERSKRPRYVTGRTKSMPGTADTLDEGGVNCPFCPGHESNLPTIIAEIPSDEPPGWSVRVAPNRFSAFTSDVTPPAMHPEQHAEAAFGFQEVIIESPDHDARLDRLDEAGMLDVVRIYRARFAELIHRSGVSTVTLFRNSGPGSGASLHHPHSQLIATGLRPPKLAATDMRAHHYYASHGRCITCDEIAAELGAQCRLVEETGAFAAFVPFAARSPAELRIMPKRHQARFDEMQDDELGEFAQLLQSVLRRLTSASGISAHNFAVHSAGADGKGAPHLHWFLRLAPLLGEGGGFEFGTDVPVNASSPEENAAVLREALA